MSVAQHLRSLSPAQRAEALTRCCGAHRWVEGMSEALIASSTHPDRLTDEHLTDEQLFTLADEVWWRLGREDYLEAFTHHPQIGASREALRERFASTEAWSAGEQASVAQASEEVIERLAVGNATYLERFGYIFIVCATGKSAAEMLALLEARLPNEPERELMIAAGEQAKITRLRLQKLIAA